MSVDFACYTLVNSLCETCIVWAMYAISVCVMLIAKLMHPQLNELNGYKLVLYLCLVLQTTAK